MTQQTHAYHVKSLPSSSHLIWSRSIFNLCSIFSTRRLCTFCTARRLAQSAIVRNKSTSKRRRASWWSWLLWRSNISAGWFASKLMDEGSRNLVRIISSWSGVSSCDTSNDAFRNLLSFWDDEPGVLLFSARSDFNKSRLWWTGEELCELLLECVLCSRFITGEGIASCRLTYSASLDRWFKLCLRLVELDARDAEPLESCRRRSWLSLRRADEDTTGVEGPVRTWWVPLDFVVGVRSSPSPRYFFGACSERQISDS